MQKTCTNLHKPHNVKKCLSRTHHKSNKMAKDINTVTKMTKKFKSSIRRTKSTTKSTTRPPLQACVGLIPRTCRSSSVMSVKACWSMASLVSGRSSAMWNVTMRPSSENASLMSRTLTLTIGAAKNHETCTCSTVTQCCMRSHHIQEHIP